MKQEALESLAGNYGRKMGRGFRVIPGPGSPLPLPALVPPVCLLGGLDSLRIGWRFVLTLADDQNSLHAVAVAPLKLESCVLNNCEQI